MMQRFYFGGILLVVAFSILGCTPNVFQFPAIEKAKKIRTEMDRLNSWDKQAIDKHENPLEDPTYMGNGETAALISVGKSRLKELGVVVRWDRKKMRYVIVDTEGLRGPVTD